MCIRDSGYMGVVRDLKVGMLVSGAKVSKIFGIRGGFKGVCATDSWMELTPEVVQDVKASEPLPQSETIPQRERHVVHLRANLWELGAYTCVQQ
eukprot:6068584-Amphidinium_carterae.1